ncbi:Hypothetical protein, putative [Bodo saltans]|uniref:Uncharacterized protein n=1 Tax=Bodo saltans TaxID=75058 RepID=A0A0S4JMZ6_BODSA|nr:Hypothetical protein, putative [Bodo saltans]|eukprot:CUG91515.1 Hypothetical protein, putative [Bodo saltans]
MCLFLDEDTRVHFLLLLSDMSFRMVPRVSNSFSAAARKRAAGRVSKKLFQQRTRDQFLERSFRDLQLNPQRHPNVALERRNERHTVSGQARQSISNWKEARKVSLMRGESPPLRLR